MAWEIEIEEIALHRKNVAALVCPGATTPVDKVYRFLFGSGSKLQELFSEKLGLTAQEYLVFLITYLKSCRYKMSVPNLRDSDDHIKTLMPPKEYNAIWKKIATMDRHAHGESFWQEVEEVLNNCYTKLFMAGDSHDDVTGIDEAGAAFKYVVGVDDDKVHYNYSQSTKTDGLKKGHHAKDNRHGFTAHTACHSATAGPLNVSFQRSEETVRATTDRMITAMFGKHTGKAGTVYLLEASPFKRKKHCTAYFSMHPQCCWLTPSPRQADQCYGWSGLG